MLEQLVQHYLGDCIALELEHQTHASAGTGVVADIRDARELSLADKLGDAQQQIVGIHLVGQLRDNQHLSST